MPNKLAADSSEGKVDKAAMGMVWGVVKKDICLWGGFSGRRKEMEDLDGESNGANSLTYI
jgi:hypothetical protein